MYEQINEPVDVLVAFNKRKTFPLFFKWSNRKFKIDKVNLVHRAKQGEETIYYYSVTNKHNYFQLAFNPRSMKWHLVELYAY